LRRAADFLAVLLLRVAPPEDFFLVPLRDGVRLLLPAALFAVRPAFLAIVRVRFTMPDSSSDFSDRRLRLNKLIIVYLCRLLLKQTAERFRVF
jgi:hypothetical protein